MRSGPRVLFIVGEFIGILLVLGALFLEGVLEGGWSMWIWFALPGLALIGLSAWGYRRALSRETIT